jgi:hypothetical protein
MTCLVDILDKYEKIDFISLTKADQEGLLDKIPVYQRSKSFHLIFPKGETKSGSAILVARHGYEVLTMLTIPTKASRGINPSSRNLNIAKYLLRESANLR